MTNQNTALPTSLPERLKRDTKSIEDVLDKFSDMPELTDYETGQVVAYDDCLRIINALLSHIKTLEMQGKWLDIKDAPKGLPHEPLLLGRDSSAGKPFACMGAWMFDKWVCFSMAGMQPFVNPTHFQYINPPSPDAQPEGSE